MYNRFVVYSRWGSVWIGINWDPKSLSLCDMCYVVFDFSLCQINEFFNCACTTDLLYIRVGGVCLDRY